MRKVLIIDSYDSFTYNLVHYLEALDCHVIVMRNDAINKDKLAEFNKIILSPGAGLPKEAGDLIPFLKRNKKDKSILGVCLGQQAIATVFGGELKPLNTVKHGDSCSITHYSNDTIYNGIPTSFNVGLYFSWETIKLPKELIPTAISKEGIIMSFKHREYDITALQYHPESIMTSYGKIILKNWLEK